MTTTTREPEKNETVAKVSFMGVMAAMFGPVGLVVAAAAVATQRALFPGVDDSPMARQARQRAAAREAMLDREAAWARRVAQHQAWLGARAAARQQHREALRAWDGNPATKPQMPVVAKDGSIRERSRRSALGELARFALAHVILGSDRARQAYPEAYAEARDLREAGQPYLGPAVVGLVKSARPGNTPATEPTPARQGEPQQDSVRQPDPAGNPAAPMQPATPQDPTNEAKPAAPVDLEDPAAQADIKWLATGGQDSNTPTADQSAGANTETTGGTMDKDDTTTAPAPQTNGPQASAPAAAETNAEVVDHDLEAALQILATLETQVAQVAEARDQLKARVAAARQRGVVAGAKDQIKAALVALEETTTLLGDSVDKAADSVVDSATLTGTARTALTPTLSHIDGLRADGGSTEMASQASAD